MTIDMVNSPNHYVVGGVETWDYIVAKCGREGAFYYALGNVIKYVSRGPWKGNFLEDLKKAQWYLNRAVELLEELH